MTWERCSPNHMYHFGKLEESDIAHPDGRILGGSDGTGSKIAVDAVNPLSVSASGPGGQNTFSSRPTYDSHGAHCRTVRNGIEVQTYNKSMGCYETDLGGAFRPEIRHDCYRVGPVGQTLRSGNDFQFVGIPLFPEELSAHPMYKALRER